MGVWGRSPQRGPGAEPLVGGQGAKPPEAESFLYIFTQKWPKVENLRENLPPCMSRAAIASSNFWSMGGGRPLSPPIAGSATVLLASILSASFARWRQHYKTEHLRR